MNKESKENLEQYSVMPSNRILRTQKATIANIELLLLNYEHVKKDIEMAEILTWQLAPWE